MKNPDLTVLEKALSDGSPVSLGSLRRVHNLDPQTVLRIIQTHPDKFSETETIEQRRQTPAVQLGTELSLKEQDFIKAIRGAGGKACYESSLHHSLKMSARQLSDMASKFAHLVSTGRRNGKVCFFWRPAGSPQERVSAVSTLPERSDASTGQLEAPAPALEELENARNALLQFLGDRSQRELAFLVNYSGLSERTILEVVRSWPEIFAMQEVNLTRVPTGAHIKISLRRAEEPESQPVQATPSLQPSVAEILSPEDAARATWRPPAPGQHTRRGAGALRDGRYRVRKPLAGV